MSTNPELGKVRARMEATKHDAKEAVLNIFEFTDYRAFLRAFYEHKRRSLRGYSMSNFVRRAGLGANSRGYLKLVIDGKRNLTPHTLRRFVQAMALPPREAIFFENLVYFNQARSAADREYYFQRLRISCEGHESAQFELLRSQFNYYSRWYFVAVRELVGLTNFREDAAWICQHLRGKITKDEAKEAIQNLLTLGLLKRDPQGKLVQSEPLVKFGGGFFSEVIQNFHIEMMERARETLLDDAYPERNASSVTLSCHRSRFDELKSDICAFRDQITTKYGVGSIEPNAVVQMNIQLFQLTPTIEENRDEQNSEQN